MARRDGRQISHVNSITPVMIVRSAVSCTAWRLSDRVYRRVIIDRASISPLIDQLHVSRDVAHGVQAALLSRVDGAPMQRPPADAAGESPVVRSPAQLAYAFDEPLTLGRRIERRGRAHLQREVATILDRIDRNRLTARDPARLDNAAVLLEHHHDLAHAADASLA
jgi:hypothetical protein